MNLDMSNDISVVVFEALSCLYLITSFTSALQSKVEFLQIFIAYIFYSVCVLVFHLFHP